MGSGLRVRGFGFRILGLGFLGSGFTVRGFGFRILGLGFRVVGFVTALFSAQAHALRLLRGVGRDVLQTPIAEAHGGGGGVRLLQFRALINEFCLRLQGIGIRIDLYNT